jgi:hypothetical protein
VRRLQRLDGILLGTLLPVWLGCFTLHIRQVVRSGMALPPVFAVPARSAGEYPEVGGLRPETFIAEPGLHVADRLLRVGNRDLRGVGYAGFYAAVLAEAGSGLSVPVELEHAGVRTVIALPLSRAPLSWYRIPGLLALVATCVFILLRAAPVGQARRFYAACMTFAVLETPFDGGSPLQTLASQTVFFVAGGLAAILILRWALLFPEEVVPSSRLPLWWAWPAGALWYATHASFFVRGPLPSVYLPAIALGVDICLAAAILGALTWNYRHAQTIGRRRVKWVLFGLYVGTLGLYFAVTVDLIDPQGPWTGAMPLLSALAMPILAAGFLIGIIRDNLYDIDRLISATTAYSAVLTGLGAAGITAIPRVAAIVAARFDIQTLPIEGALAIGLAALLVPSQRLLRPWIDRLFFKRRSAFQHGVTELLRELSVLEAPSSLLRRAGEALCELLHPRACVVYARDGQDYAPVFGCGRDNVPAVAADGPMVAAIARQSRPIARERSTLRGNGPELTAFDRAALEALGAELIVPVHRQNGLAAFICLGSTPSGDAYTPSEVTLLAVIAHTLAAQLDRLNGWRSTHEPAPSEVHQESVVSVPAADLLAAPAAANRLARSAHNLFRKEGDYWSISFDGNTLRLKDAKGLQYLAQLLRHPGQDFHALDLVSETFVSVDNGTRNTEQGLRPRDQKSDTRDHEPLLDRQAKAAYTRRLVELREELREAEQFNDAGRAAKAREEIDFVTHELSAAVGLGSRDRKSGAHAERARLLVTQRIKATLKKIRAAHPSLGHHLATTIKTGYFCNYTPDPNHTIKWLLGLLLTLVSQVLLRHSMVGPIGIGEW